MFVALYRSCFWYICVIIGIGFIALHGKAFSSTPPVNETPIYPDDTQLTAVSIPQDIERPTYLQPMIDSVFGTQVIRISDQVGFGSNAMALRHTDATNQPWNADGSLLMLGHTNPAALLDGQTYAFLRWVYQPSDAMWLHTDPHSMIGTLSDNNQLVRFDIRMDWSYEIMHTFDEFDVIGLGARQSNLSTDDRSLVFFGFTENQTTLVVYDLQDETIGSRLDLGTDQVGTDEKTQLLSAAQIGQDFYVPCRNTDRPGWAYISHFGNDAPEKPYFGEAFVVKLDGSGTVNRFAHTHHTMQDNFANCPMVAPNQDGSRVLWASDWGDVDAPVYT